MKGLTATLTFTATLILIWSSFAKAQSVSATERQQFSTTQTSNARGSQGVTPRSASLMPNNSYECWRCSSPCGNSYCCADSHPQCCLLEDSCRCCVRE